MLPELQWEKQNTKKRACAVDCMGTSVAPLMEQGLDCNT